MEPTKKGSAVAFFDFDGTVTKKDSFLHFIFFTKGILAGIIGFMILSPIILVYKMKLLNNSKAKEIVFAYFFKGIQENELRIKGLEFETVINKMVRPEALEKINWHKKNRHKVYIVTASSEIWLAAWCKQNNLEIIATMYEVINGHLTGKISGINCYGNEKVKRISASCNLSEYTDIYAYGDSKGDIPMLEIANEKFYKKF